MFLGGGSASSRRLQEWLLRKQSSRNCLERSSLCSLTMSIRASLCRCSIGDIKRHSVIVRSAVFWQVWSFFVCIALDSGDHIGETLYRTSRPIALYVASNVCLSFSQELPASDLRILLRLCTLTVIAVVWGVKEQRLSSVTPKIPLPELNIVQSSAYEVTEIRSGGWGSFEM